MGALGKYVETFNVPVDTLAIGATYGRNVLRSATRITAEPLLADPQKFWQPLFFRPLASKLTGPKELFDATNYMFPLIDQALTALKDTESTQVARFIEEGWKACITGLHMSAGSPLQRPDGTQVVYPRNTNAMDLFRNIAVKLSNPDTAKHNPRGYHEFYKSTAKRIARTAHEEPNPQNITVVDSLLHLATHENYGIGGDISLFPVVYGKNQAVDVLGRLQADLTVTEQHMRPRQQVEFVTGMNRKLKQYMDAPEVDNQRAWNLGNRSAELTKAFVGNPLDPGYKPTAYAIELTEQIGRSAEEGSEYWRKFTLDTRNDRYGVDRKETRYMDGQNAQHSAVLKAAEHVNPNWGASIIETGEEALLTVLDQGAYACILPLFDQITEPHLLPRSRGELLRKRLTDPQHYVAERMRHLTNPNYGVDALYSVAQALEQDLQAFVKRAKGLERMEDKQAAAHAAEVILDQVDGQADVGVRARLVNLYRDMVTDMQGAERIPSALAQADAIQTTETMRQSLAKELPVLDAAQTDEAASGNKPKSEGLFDKVAESLRPYWQEYFDRLLNANYGFGSANDISEMLNLKQDALMREVAKADYDLSGAFLWAGVKEAFMAMKKPARGDIRQRVMFTVLRLLVNSPVALELIAREGSEKGQKATATIRSLQTRAIAELIGDEKLARGMLPYIETKTKRPKDPQEHMLWIVFATAIKDSQLVMQSDETSLVPPDDRQMAKFEASFIAALENNPVLIEGDKLAILELVGSFRPVFPMAVEALADMHVWGRETKNTRKPGSGNKAKEAKMAILGRQLDPSAPDDETFYTYWNEVGKAPLVGKGLRLPRRANVEAILKAGFAIESVKGDALELLQRYMGDVCQLTDVPGYVALAENRAGWDTARRMRLVDVLMGAVEQVVNGDAYDKADGDKKWMQSTAASILYLAGGALREWGREDAAIKSHAADRLSNTLVKIIGRAGTENAYAAPVTEMAWEVVEQFIPYWNRNDAVGFVTKYIAEARRNRNGGEASYFADGKLFRIFDMITTRGDVELWPVAGETERIAAVEGDTPATALWVRPGQTQALMPVMQAIVASWHSWHTQDTAQRLYQVLGNALEDDGRRIRPVDQLQPPAQMLRLAERVATAHEKKALATLAMTGVQDQLAGDIREELPLEVGSLYDAAQRLVEGGMREAVHFVGDIEAMQETVHELRSSVIDAEFDSASGSLVIKGRTLPGSARAGIYERIHADNPDSVQALIERIGQSVAHLRDAASGERVTDAQSAALLALPGAVETKSPLMKQLRSLVEATQRPAPLAQGVAAVPLLNVYNSPYDALIYASTIAARDQMGAAVAGSLEAVNRGRQEGAQQVVELWRETGHLQTENVAEQSVQAALNFTTHAIASADDLARTLRRSPKLLADAAVEQTAYETAVIKALIAAQKGIEESEIQHQMQLVDEMLAEKRKLMLARIDLYRASVDELLPKVREAGKHWSGQRGRLFEIGQKHRRKVVSTLIDMVDPDGESYGKLHRSHMAIRRLTGETPDCDIVSYTACAEDMQDDALPQNGGKAGGSKGQAAALEAPADRMGDIESPDKQVVN